MVEFREENDSLGTIKVPSNRLWGAQTQRSLEYFNIGTSAMPKELIAAFALIKKACAIVNERQGRLSRKKGDLIAKACDEILQGKHLDHFPLRIWMTGSGTQFNMNINEVIANRCAEMCGAPLGTKHIVHPNDDVNMSQSSNDTFPTAMYIAAAKATQETLLPAIQALRNGLHAKALEWQTIVKLGRTHLQDAVPLTLGQEFSGYVQMLDDDISQVEQALPHVYRLALGGTAVGTGINTLEGFDQAACQEIAKMTGLPFIAAPNKFAVQGAHNALVYLSSALKGLAVSLYKIGNDIRFLAAGPRAGIYELLLPANEPGSSIMPGKINPTQCEAICMVSLQVIANDVAVGLGSAGGHLEMNVYKPLILYNIMESIQLLAHSSDSFDKFLVRDLKANLKKINANLSNSLMLVTALTPLIGYDKAAKIAHLALEEDITLREAALQLGYLSAEDFDRLVVPMDMCHPRERE